MSRGSRWHTGMSSFLVDKHIFDLVAHRFGFFVEEKENEKKLQKKSHLRHPISSS